MDTSKSSGAKRETSSDAWEAIAAFEQILAAIPNDYVALEALSHAYEMVGDITRSREYLIRLATVLIEKRDVDSALLLTEKLQQHADVDPAAKRALTEIETMMSTAAGSAVAAGGASVTPRIDHVTERAREAMRRTNAVSEELTFAWHLHQKELLTPEEYSRVAQDLTEISASESNVTVSVLYVLNDRGFRALEGILVFAAKDTNTPPISLSNIELVADTVNVLPLDYMIRRGVIVFELLGFAAIVALLNPYNKELRQEVESLIARPCHFFLTSPTDFDSAINKIKGLNQKPPPESAIPPPSPSAAPA